METKQQKLIDYFLKEKNGKLEEFHKLKIIVYECNVLILRGRSSKPMVHYKFNTHESRSNFIDKKKKEVMEDIEREKKIQENNELEKQKFIPGAILYSSWGYEQTNVDFYIIIERKGSILLVQKIGKNKFFDECNNQVFDDRGSCMPDPDFKIGEPFRKRLGKHPSITLNTYSYARLWDGKPKYWSSYA